MKSLKSHSPPAQTGPPASFTSSEDEATFKAKWEHLTEVVKKLQKELKYQRLRSEGLHSIAKCLQEERDENISLRSYITTLQQQQQQQQLQKSSVGDNKVPRSQDNRQQDIYELEKQKIRNESQERIKTLENHISKLDLQLQEVTQMNSRWQVYNEQREAYVKALVEKITSLEQHLIQMEKDSNKKDVDKENIDAMLHQYQKKINLSEDELRHLQDENKRLLAKTRISDEEVMHLKKANAYLSSQVKAYQTSPRSDDSEKIQMLEAQIRICTEDFESERKDRERAAARVAELEKAMGKLQTERDVLYRHHTINTRRRQQEAISNQRGNYHNYHPAGPSRLVSHSPYQMDGRSDSPSLGHDTVNDGPEESLRSGPERSMEEQITQSVRDEENLQCPRCGKSYPIIQHLELLNHIDECCD